MIKNISAQNQSYIDSMYSNIELYPDKWSAVVNDYYKFTTRDILRKDWYSAIDLIQHNGMLSYFSKTRNTRSSSCPSAYSLLALVAYDDCERFMNSEFEELSLLHKLGTPRTGLFIPVAYLNKLVNDDRIIKST